ncbi:MAG TPA: hypothetical protein VGM52_04215 [Herbaspirillum sp.]|jgi:hypothetical protein
MALSGISQSIEPTAYRSYEQSPNSTAVFTTDGLPGTAPPVIAKTDAPAAAQPGTGDLSSIIANLGKSYAGAQTYNADGRLNSAGLSGQAPAAQAVPALPEYQQDLSDLAVVNAGTLYSPDDASGIYTPSGDLQDLPIYAVNAKGSGTIVNTQA